MQSKRPPYLLHLAQDKRLGPLLEGIEPVVIAPQEEVWLHLTGAIMSQQLSTRVASVIRGRFTGLYGGNPSPERVLETPSPTLRAIGLSNAKVTYVQNIARFALEEGLSFGKLQEMEDEGVIDYLTQIKGVGRWTAEMMLMFSLGREDVFAVDDLGIQQAMMRIYRLKNGDKRTLREKMLKISGKWSPYRTYACLHLWRLKDFAPGP
ncbi:DNA-3-methyladenine glycosylase family protein [Dinghuibacter silviterrae]|uniref:DNA-3-methyladenine glycosylase II n=1 Tax=Dinghuibacter silviterrae TaxID=1539049 RepID=A0A4R8DQ62_9BACT|nr:DNA-3-methyladenine glycosylase [Dinghuibacter silviterrae]TDW99544.1 DNA-3-methyladenine glycosylase II [Dinghuibacter silviterrae]